MEDGSILAIVGLLGIAVNVFGAFVATPLIMWEDAHYDAHKKLTIWLWMVKSSVGFFLACMVIVPMLLYATVFATMLSWVVDDDGALFAVLVACILAAAFYAAFYISRSLFSFTKSKLQRFAFLNRKEAKTDG